MIDNLRAIAIFAHVAETGSFRGAAKALGISASVVSHNVNVLEEHLGVPLFYRSTRKVTLTHKGQHLLGPAREMLEAAQSGLAQFIELADAPVGTLKVSLPAVLTSHPIVDHLAAFSKSHPSIALSLRFSDVRENIIDAGLDLAIRMGHMDVSTLSQRHLVTEARYLIASREFVDNHQPIVRPNDLETLDFIQFSPRLKPLSLSDENGNVFTLGGKVKISVDNSQAMHRLALAGVGFAALPLAIIEPDLKSGELAHLLPDWTLPSLPINAVWPRSSTRNRLTLRLLDYLTENLSPPHPT